MDFDKASKRRWLVCLYECFGTMLFITSILCTNNSSSIAFSLFASIIIFGGITGGHFNPAVTTGVFIQEGNMAANAASYALIMLSQIVGGLLA
jgi:aquaporin Z